MKDWRKRNKDKVKEYNRVWFENNKERERERKRASYPLEVEARTLRNIKQRAEKLGVPFNLTVEDIQPPETCPVFGFPLIRNIGGKLAAPNSPSVDRIVPELGYVKGNIQIISYKANVMKNDATQKN